MSTNQQLTPPTPETPTPPRGSRLDLSVTKVLGGALAAMTAAALGSRLSVAGTVIGAAIASIIAAVASALYTASLKHTQEKVKTVFSGRAAGSDLPTTVEVVSDHDTRVSSAAPAQPAAPQPDPHWALPPAEAGSTDSAGPGRTVSWKSIVVGALAAFAIAAAGLTGFELVSGHALSGGGGTTITQVGSGNTGGTDTKSEKPAATPTPTASSAEPSESASSEPSVAPSASAAPTSRPSASATAVPTPSATQEPSTSASASEPAPSVGPSAGAGASSDSGSGG